jgi:NADPH:quinone reductase-like Zn-dependent oxidoreductase
MAITYRSLSGPKASSTCPVFQTLARRLVVLFWVRVLIDDGKVRVKIAAAYAFDATRDALAMLEKRHVHGKIVVDAAGSNARTM